MEQADENSFLEGAAEAKIPWLYLILSIFGIYVFLPVSALFNLAHFTTNPLPSHFVVNVAFFAFFVHCVLVLPVTRFVYPQLPEWIAESRVARGLLVLCLLSPPLISFAYYLDGIKQLVDVHEVFLQIGLGVGLGVVFFEITGRPWVFSLVLFLCTAIPFFFVNDVLNSTLTKISYFSQGGAFYVWRTLITLIVFVGVLIIASKKYWKLKEEESGKNWAFLLIALGIYTLAIKIVIPICYSAFTADSTVQPVMDFWWVLFLLSGAVLLRPNRLSYVLLVALATLRSVTLVGEFIYFGIQLRTGFWELSQFANQLIVLTTMVWFSTFLLDPSTRKRFSTI